MLRCAQHDSAVLLLRHGKALAFRWLSPLLFPLGVMLSAAKGLARWAERCFAALSMTVPVPYCRAIATDSRSSGLMKWSLSSTPASNCTQLILPLNALVCIV